MAVVLGLVLCCAAWSADAETHALVVGIGAYPEGSGFTPLTADEDAEAFGEVLTRLGVNDVSVQTGSRATRKEIGLWFLRPVFKPGDLVYIYLAGHGGGIADRTGRDAEIGAFFPYDAKKREPPLLGDTAEEGTVITEYDLSQSILEWLPNCDVVVFLDSCRSALIARSDLDLGPTRAVRGEGAFVPRGLAEIVRRPEDTGRTFVFASSSEFEPSFEDPTPGRRPHGLFTRCLLNGLVCDADADADRRVSFRELSSFLTTSVAELSRSRTAKGVLQTPVAVCDQMSAENEEFVVADVSCDLAIRFPDDLTSEEGADSLVPTGLEEVPQESIVFADRELDRTIRLILEKPWGDITRADCEEIVVLLAPNKGIRSLVGLEALSNLTHVDLRWNEISDFGPLTGMKKLKLLDLSSNQVSDLALLEGLAPLTALYLSGDPPDDVTVMRWLTEVKELRLTATLWRWVDDLVRTYDPAFAARRVTGTVVLDPSTPPTVYPGETYTFTAHVTMVVTGEPVVQIVRFVTRRSCEGLSDCSRAVYWGLFPEGVHSFDVQTVYEVPPDAEPGRVLWYAFEVEFAPHSGWVIGAP